MHCQMQSTNNHFFLIIMLQWCKKTWKKKNIQNENYQKKKKKAEDQTGNDASDQNPVSGHQQGKHLYSNFFKKAAFTNSIFCYHGFEGGKSLNQDEAGETKQKRGCKNLKKKRQRVKKGAIRREESGGGRSSWSPTLLPLSPPHSLPLSLSLFLGKKRTNATTNLHALLWRPLVFVHICGPADTVGPGWWSLVRRWGFRRQQTVEEEKDRQERWRRRRRRKEKKKLWQRRFGVWVAAEKEKKSPAGNSRETSASWEKRGGRKKSSLSLGEERREITRKEVSRFTHRSGIECAARFGLLLKFSRLPTRQVEFACFSGGWRRWGGAAF